MVAPFREGGRGGAIVCKNRKGIAALPSPMGRIRAPTTAGAQSLTAKGGAPFTQGSLVWRGFGGTSFASSPALLPRAPSTTCVVPLPPGGRQPLRA
mgnify:CR=1 FL=1